MSGLNNVAWKLCYGNVTNKRLSFLEDEINVSLPNIFKQIIVNCDGGVPSKSIFTYYDRMYEENLQSSVGGFLNFSKSEWSDFYQNYIDPPEFFPKNLIAFASTGGGDYICFDYRQGKDNINPPIVFWNHGADIGKDVSFIADNFEEFMNMLSEPDDLI